MESDNKLDPVMSALVDKLYQQLSGQIKLLIKDKKLDAMLMISLTISIMEMVEKLPNMKGGEKKAIVLALVKKTIEDNAGDEKAILLPIVDNILPVVIDTVVNASRGKYNINGKWKAVKRWFGKCKCC